MLEAWDSGAVSVRAKAVHRGSVNVRLHVFDLHNGHLIETIDIASIGRLFESSVTAEQGLQVLLRHGVPGIMIRDQFPFSPCALGTRVALV